MKNTFVKSHGLGNDYIILDEENVTFELTEDKIVEICDVHFGIGSDGILLKTKSDKADFGLRILNPDGSEAEKSGNGLRIFAKYLYDYQHTTSKKFTIDTLGGKVTAEIMEVNNDKACLIKVDMGKAIFESELIPVKTETNECIDYPLNINGEIYRVNCVSVGNPHCVVVKDELNKEEIMKVGSLIENHEIFPNRINVQFVKVINRNEVEILIWERGAGWTLASGSSSCAVASIVMKKGLTDRKLTVKMPGGELKINIDEEWNIEMTGKVQEIATGVLSDELINN